ncbi:hypothetical protein BDR03DRAFT_1012002 [Suillus americanus]|nr:hypothetical protein BDR03DRAFT_1012002 [Suillus americanus]
MYTCEEVGINSIETAQDLSEASFAWAPLLSTEPHDADDLLAGTESISPDDIAAEFAALKKLKGAEEVQSNNETLDSVNHRFNQAIMWHSHLQNLDYYNQS